MNDLSSRALFASGCRTVRSTSVGKTILRTSLRALLVSWISMIVPAAVALGQSATTTTLVITNPVSSAASTPTDPTPVPYKTPITLTATEFELLRFMMRNSKRVLSKAQILDRVWSYDFGGRSNIVELYVSYLRKKIDSGRDPMIHTLRGAGYVLKPAR